ncbi:MAG: AbrB/MazE/SpoVT family DNA-binding domain-containing protein [Candidatus Heimdallarchaeota archaeon]|nr:AbrB/MazE/SpoVT family DNA-binding domain-containing protein [Candidatus Heimdallarchaeota archaeon]
MKFLGSSKLYGKNQITIPKDVVKALEVEVGEQVLFLLDQEGKIIITSKVTIPQDKEK